MSCGNCSGTLEDAVKRDCMGCDKCIEPEDVCYDCNENTNDCTCEEGRG